MAVDDVRSGFRRSWSDLASVGRNTAGGYDRFAWTRTDHDLREWFAGEASDLGLDLTTDRVGNQWAWWGDPYAAGAAPAVVTGSHLDSVPSGGAFDGPLGVVSSLLAVRSLRAAGHRPDRPMAVVNFVDEEGARFGVACAGSRILTGALSPERALALTDADGTTMADALAAAGRDPLALGSDPDLVGRIGAFVELHVEQGRALDDVHANVGVGSHIWPHGRWRIDVPGEANHAGTTALDDRRDAMLGFAAAVIAARRAAQSRGCVATVGKVRATPNGVNAIPSEVNGWLDARGESEAAVHQVVADVTEVMADFEATVREESWTPTTAFDDALVRRLASRLGGIPVLGTGAGHDAGILAGAGVRAAMLFVRNPTGISHSPEEFAEEADCLAGVDALTRVLADLTGATP